MEVEHAPRIIKRGREFVKCANSDCAESNELCVAIFVELSVRELPKKVYECAQCKTRWRVD